MDKNIFTHKLFFLLRVQQIVSLLYYFHSCDLEIFCRYLKMEGEGDGGGGGWLHPLQIAPSTECTSAPFGGLQLANISRCELCSIY